MRKRRTESPSLHECSPQRKKKKKWLSGDAAEPEVEEDAEPGLRNDPDTILVDERRRKRPRCCEDHEAHAKHGPRTSAQVVAAADSVNTADTRASGTFVTACMRGMASGESASGSGEVHAEVTSPDDNEDNLCAFNSFHFWRTPLPELDLSLLDSPSTAKLTVDSSSKDATEDMET